MGFCFGPGTGYRVQFYQRHTKKVKQDCKLATKYGQLTFVFWGFEDGIFGIFHGG